MACLLTSRSSIALKTTYFLSVQLYLSEASLGVAITTAKSSAINVVVPSSDNSDPVELPVPEQFVSTIQNGRLLTEAVSHSGG